MVSIRKPAFAFYLRLFPLSPAYAALLKVLTTLGLDIREVSAGADPGSHAVTLIPPICSSDNVALNPDRSRTLTDHVIAMRRRYPIRNHFLMYDCSGPPRESMSRALYRLAVTPVYDVAGLLACCATRPRPLSDHALRAILESAVQCQVRFFLHELRTDKPVSPALRQAIVEFVGQAKLTKPILSLADPSLARASTAELRQILSHIQHGSTP